MEETFTNQPNIPAEQPLGIVLLQDAQSYLLGAGKWARFLGIMGFIGTGFLVLCALFIGTFMSALASLSPMTRMAAFPGGLVSLLYLLIAVFYFFVSLYTYQFGARVKEGVVFGNSATVTQGLGKLKSSFKLIGIVTIVIMILYVFILVGVVIFVSLMGHSAVVPGY